MGIDHLRKAHWDRLFKLVQRAGFTPLVDIVRADVPGDMLGFPGNDRPALIHRPTKFYFAISELPEPSDRLWRGRPHGPFGVAFAPGDETPDGVRQYLNFDQVAAECEQWLERVHEDSGPDLWELAAQDRRSLLGPGGGRDLENTPFTDTERQRIGTSLDALRAEIVKTQRLSAEQAKALGAAVADLKAASERLGRKDWLLFMYGTIMSVAVSAAFAPEQARCLWQVASHALAWVFGVGPPLLPRRTESRVKGPAVV
jgi:hypothetical protein